MRAIGGIARRAVAALEGFVLEPPNRPAGTTDATGPTAASTDSPAAHPARAATVVLATAIGRSAGSASLAAAVGVAAADHAARGVLLVDLDPPARGRGPTVLASDPARGLEDRLRALGDPYRRAAARGRLCYLPLGREAGADEGDDADPLADAARALEADVGASAAIVHVPQSLWPRAIGDPGLRGSAALIRAELPTDRHLAALAVGELHSRGLRVKIVPRPLGAIASRRALAGIDPAGAASARATRLSRALLGLPATE